MSRLATTTLRPPSSFWTRRAALGMPGRKHAGASNVGATRGYPRLTSSRGFRQLLAKLATDDASENAGPAPRARSKLVVPTAGQWDALDARPYGADQGARDLGARVFWVPGGGAKVCPAP